MENILTREDFVSLKLNEGIIPDFILEKLQNNLVGKIDYTLLKPEATEDQILELCAKADKLGVKSVCVLPKMVKVAKEALKDSKVLVCTVISFPHGTDSTGDKIREARGCMSDGADECDMVLNYPDLKKVGVKIPEEGNMVNFYDENPQFLPFIEDVESLVMLCHKHTNKDGDPVTLKVIVESGLLSSDETAMATYICLDGSADFIKTSTGMVPIGAELDKVQIMKKIIEDEYNNEHVGIKMKIKASGGIRTLEDLQKFNPLVDRFGVGFAAVDKIFGDGGDVVLGSY